MLAAAERISARCSWAITRTAASDTGGRSGPRTRRRRSAISAPGFVSSRRTNLRLSTCADPPGDALDEARARRPDRVRRVDQRRSLAAAAVSRAARRQAPGRSCPGAPPVSKALGGARGRVQAGVDRWAAGRSLLFEADPRMAELVNAEPGLDPNRLFDGLPSDLLGSACPAGSVSSSRLSAAAILTRLEALQGGRMPTPAELLATDAEPLRGIGMSRAKAAYLHDLAARLEDGRLDPDRQAPSTTMLPGSHSPRSRASAGSPPTEC
jgi:hypothetical protein